MGLTCHTVSSEIQPWGRGLDDIGLDDPPHVFGGQVFIDVLCGKDDLRHADRLAGDIFDRNLALGVGTEFYGIAVAGFARLGENFQNFMRIVQRRRHQTGRLVGRIAKHDALVAGAFILVAGGVNALGDIGGLRVQQNFDNRSLPMETGLFVANVLDRLANDFLDLFMRNIRAAHFAGDDHAIGGHKRLCGDADLIGVYSGLLAFAIVEIDDFIRNPIRDLVGMTFGYRFARKQKIAAGHDLPPNSKALPRRSSDRLLTRLAPDIQARFAEEKRRQKPTARR